MCSSGNRLNVLDAIQRKIMIVRFFLFFKQKTAYEMRISDWSSDVCSSDLRSPLDRLLAGAQQLRRRTVLAHQVVAREIGRASCRERVCQYVSISVVAVSLKKKTIQQK